VVDGTEPGLSLPVPAHGRSRGSTRT
jgi:hypothetical protein